MPGPGSNPEAPVFTPSAEKVATPAVKFLSSNSRQRSSNIPTKEPELEFLKVSLDTCRGTIAQQQSEIKKLNETLDIRNKVIVQLEAQVGHAADHLAARVGHTTSNIATGDISALLNIDKNVTTILSRLSNLSVAPVNHFNIHNDSICHNIPRSQTQTDPSECKSCKTSYISSVDDHTNDAHGNSSSNANPYSTGSGELACNTCGRSFVTQDLLTEHIETSHHNIFLSCEDCDYKCKTTAHMNYHIVSCHQEPSAPPKVQNIPAANYPSMSTAL